MPDVTTMEATVQQLLEAFGRQDAAATGALHAPDSVVYDPGHPEPLRGRQAIQDEAQAWFTAAPDTTMEAVRFWSSAEGVAAEVVIRGHQTGPLGDIPPTNLGIRTTRSRSLAFQRRRPHHRGNPLLHARRPTEPTGPRLTRHAALVSLLPTQATGGQPMKLEGKVAIITGVGPNIGRAVALEFAREGAKVAVNHRRPEQADSTVAMIRDDGRASHGHPLSSRGRRRCARRYRAGGRCVGPG